MCRMLHFALAFAAALAPAPSGLPELLARVAEEAEVLRQSAPKALTQETLEQRAVMPPSRFRPRIGKAALEPTKPRLRVREIVSEYSVGTLRQSASDRQQPDEPLQHPSAPRRADRSPQGHAQLLRLAAPKGIMV